MSAIKQPTAWVCEGLTGLPARAAVKAFLEIVPGGGRPLAAELDEAVVDAAAVDEALARVEDGRFRRDGGAGHLHERAIAIAFGDWRITEVPKMPGDRRLVIERVRIDQAESHAAGCELVVQPLDFRRVSIRNGTIDADEDQHRHCQGA